MAAQLTTRIVCGKLYTGLAAEFLFNHEIIVRGDEILSVGPAGSFTGEAALRDLSAFTVTPGIIDAHIHPAFIDPAELYDDPVKNSDGWRVLSVARTAQKCLEGGFTTIRAIGWFQEDYVLDAKRFIDRGYLGGARIIACAHALGTTGSHGDFSQTYRDNPHTADNLVRLNAGTGDGADFFTHAVRREKKLGSDFIKIMATGGFMSPFDGPDDIQFSDAELEAIFSTAHAVGLPVTAHAYSPQLIQKLIGLGIAGIEHGSLMDAETAALMEETGTYLVGTFGPYDAILSADESRLAQLGEQTRRKFEQYGPRLAEGRKIIVNSSIKLGYGTDIVSVYNNYESGREYGSLLRSGLDPFRILQAATKNNAEICGIDSFTGTIEPGKAADIAGWRRDLLTDPDALRDCAFVMKSGVEYPTGADLAAAAPTARP
ncbi:MAG: amidohydrolase family protein [Coriobacteriales bacterium]|nr:amidohydrolase family protein [Coriobacteriales bacterium]